jgi:hypothetical protein
VTTPRDLKPSQRPSSIRMDARLDSMTWEKVDDPARHFGRPRAAVLCHIMHWGVRQEQTGPLDQGKAQGPVHHLHLYVASDLHAQVERAAAAAEMKIAPWLRHMMRQVSTADFPARWQEAQTESHSHDSHIYGKRFLSRLDSRSQTKLQQLVKQFGVSKADIIRQLIAQAEPEDFPKSWRIRAAERSVPPMRRRGTKNQREIPR